MKSILLIALLVLLNFSAQAQQNRLSKNDLQLFIGTWKGTLTYLDYTKGKPFSMPAELSVRSSKPGLLFFSYTYPKEPEANGVDTVIISKKRDSIDEIPVTDRMIDKGITMIITEKKGTDGNDNKPAILRYVYTIGDNVFIKRKEVKFDGKEEWILRNEFNFRRN